MPCTRAGPGRRPPPAPPARWRRAPRARSTPGRPAAGARAAPEAARATRRSATPTARLSANTPTSARATRDHRGLARGARGVQRRRSDQQPATTSASNGMPDAQAHEDVRGAARTSCASPSASVVGGKERVAERGDGAAHAEHQHAGERQRRACTASEPGAAQRGRASCVAHHAVSVSAATSRNVFTRCPAIHQARATSVLPATSSSRTSPAPMSASSDHEHARRRARSAAPDARAGSRARPRRRARRRAAARGRWSARWPSSISVAVLGDARDDLAVAERPVAAAAGARSPIARTNAPHRITAEVRAQGRPGERGVARHA